MSKVAISELKAIFQEACSELGIPKKTADRVRLKVIDRILTTLANGQEIRLPFLGVLYPKVSMPILCGRGAWKTNGSKRVYVRLRQTMDSKILLGQRCPFSEDRMRDHGKSKEYLYT